MSAQDVADTLHAYDNNNEFHFLVESPCGVDHIHVFNVTPCYPIDYITARYTDLRQFYDGHVEEWRRKIARSKSQTQSDSDYGYSGFGYGALARDENAW